VLGIADMSQDEEKVKLKGEVCATKQEELRVSVPDNSRYIV